MASNFRIGLIGYGAWGSHHARAISSVPGAELSAICAHSPATVQQAESAYPHAKVYSNYHELLNQERLDACVVVLPSHLHFQAAAAVLRSGCHLLLEKPMALSASDCEELVQLAKRQRLLLAVGHELRLSSLWGKVKQLIEEGAIGEPLYCLVELWRRPYRLGSDGWRYDLQRVGNWILEEPIHFFDLARWYFASVGEPQTIYATGNGKRPDHPNLHDNFSALVTFSQGRYAVITQTLAGWQHHQTVKLTGTEGSLWARWSGAMDRTFEPTFSLQLSAGDSATDIPIDTPAGEVYELVEQFAAFVRSIQDGRPVACTGEDGAWSVTMCLKAQESLERGAVVSFL